MINVLIVDDSALIRQALSSLFSDSDEIEVIGTASDPYLAANKIAVRKPDVIILDIEMPRMDGLTFLRKIMTQHPIPVIICSSMAGFGSQNALKALEFGAVEVIEKPKVGKQEFFKESQVTIIDSVKAAYLSKQDKKKYATSPFKVLPKLNADVILSKGHGHEKIETTEKIVVVGASTGGTEALKNFLEVLPRNCPGIVIVQHMPENFTRAFSERLNTSCEINVKEAENNDTILRGGALIAPGNKHIIIKRSGARYYIQLLEGPLVSRHRPSVDVLFRSAAKYVGKNAIGVIMTGMGDDGAKGMLEMKQAGSFNISQDETSSVVYGMPFEAQKLGAVHVVLPLDRIADKIISLGQ